MSDRTLLRDLAIPVAGTLLAVVAVLLSRGERPAPAADGGLPWHRDVGPVEFRLRVAADGGLRDTVSGERFAGPDAFLADLFGGQPPPRDEPSPVAIVLDADAGVEPERLESVAEALRVSCDVRIEQRDEKAPTLPEEETEARDREPREDAAGAQEGDPQAGPR